VLVRAVRSAPVGDQRPRQALDRVHAATAKPAR
jgi:hypothetical protein